MKTFLIIFALLIVVALLGILVKKILSLRRIVPPNEVHVIRQGDNTLIYGATNYNCLDLMNESSGNVYYAWPDWLPIIGVSILVLPLHVFDIKLDDYRCYDKDRLPFSADIHAFFRITNYKIAASRIKGATSLNTQLRAVLEGTARHLLGNRELESIMGEYSEYSEEFTKNVKEALSNWGISTTKNIQIMDIRDVPGEKVISNIMQRKKSEVEKQSRMAIARNNRIAREAELEAAKSVKLKEQDLTEAVGKREAEVSANVGIEKEKANQKVHEQAKTTKAKEMDVLETERTRQAEIEKKSQTIIAETQKRKLEIESAGQLAANENEAKGIEAKGKAQADAEKRYQMASVEAQAALAQEVGDDQEYLAYLIRTKQIDAAKLVGLKQAENLSNADIRILAGAGDVSTGVGKATGILSPNTGFNMASLLEALGTSEEGQQLLASINTFLSKGNSNAGTTPPSTPKD